MGMQEIQWSGMLNTVSQVGSPSWNSCHTLNSQSPEHRSGKVV